MDDAKLASLEAALTKRGGALAFNFGFPFGGYLGNEDLEFNLAGVVRTDPGQKPGDTPPDGILLIHSGRLNPPRPEAFRIGWFLGPRLVKLFDENSSGQSEQRATELALELGDVLATDKYTLEQHTAHLSKDLFADYIGGDLAPPLFWLRFSVEGLFDTPEVVLLAFPLVTVDRMFSEEPPPAKAGAAAKPAAAPAPTPPQHAAEQRPSPPPESDPTVAPAPRPGAPKLSPGLQRLLRTRVPVIVTLASQEIPAKKLLDLGPGAIIEFERSCEEPLHLSVNNVPIGFGEPVKIGDHFGLKVVGVVPVAERLEQLGGKWKF